jgi:hypothetical protein
MKSGLVVAAAMAQCPSFFLGGDQAAHFHKAEQSIAFLPTRQATCELHLHCLVVEQPALFFDGWIDIPFADGHTASNAPDLFRPPKLSGAGPG